VTTPRASLPSRVAAARTTTGTAENAFAALILFTLFAGDFWRNTISWPGYFILAGVLAVISAVLVVRSRPVFRWRTTPKTLVVFLALAIVSIAWSAYPGASALGTLTTLVTTIGGLFLGVRLGWPRLLSSLGNAFRWILGLSLVFEFVVAVFVRHPVLPLTPVYTVPSGKLPQAFYWSRDLLFHGGPIQGIVGNSNLLAMVALLAIIVFGIQVADRTTRHGTALGWLVVAVLTLALTRSATVIAAGLATAVVLAFALWARRAGAERRTRVYVVAFIAVAAVIAAVSVFGSRIPALFGKSEDLTGRFDIWSQVIGLAQQRPVVGWGWVSYWAPWVKPFDGLATRGGVEYLQAHNAWLDVWLQLGIVGLVVFILLVLTTLGRAWFTGIDRPRFTVVDDQPYTATSLLPLLLLAALIAQSFAESRILIEGGWALFVALAIGTKRAARIL
jgi:O-antigen ligase